MEGDTSAAQQLLGGTRWPWGFSLGSRGPLFRREISKETVAHVKDFRSLCGLMCYVRKAAGSVQSNSLEEVDEVLASAFSGLNNAIQAFTTYVQSQLDRPEFDFYVQLLPMVLDWAITIEDDYVKHLPLLQRGIEVTSELSSRQIRHILANSFILNVSDLRPERFGELCFGNLYSTSIPVSVHRILCQLAYFYRVSDAPQRVVSFSRFQLKEEDLLTKGKDVVIGRQSVVVHTDRMEVSDEDHVFFDFANKDIHIHLIIPSATQEEVLFSCCPEAFVSILFCERMSDYEGITISGTIRFADYTGYQNSFRFSGYFESPAFKRCDILVLDAAVGAREQFSPSGLRRDLSKAYLGFHACATLLSRPKIATGHWGLVISFSLSSLCLCE
eukprot:TRINITY_DN9564_c0_g1_i1.p1 TRINITY_DN9564_c0_g1~~TRINITY_DN9564_c0_g1_i1.p1  ORF type:complete len:399 (+),score=64.07 TRINITY_DN9564_c0_g1_i1:40-1197(+)